MVSLADAHAPLKKTITLLHSTIHKMLLRQSPPLAWAVLLCAALAVVHSQPPPTTPGFTQSNCDDVDDCQPPNVVFPRGDVCWFEEFENQAEPQGFCCDVPCPASCHTCAFAGDALGECTAIPIGDPFGECAPVSPLSGATWECWYGICRSFGDEPECESADPCMLPFYDAEIDECTLVENPDPQCSDPGYGALPCVRRFTPEAVFLAENLTVPLDTSEWALWLETYNVDLERFPPEESLILPTALDPFSIDASGMVMDMNTTSSKGLFFFPARHFIPDVEIGEMEVEVTPLPWVLNIEFHEPVTLLNMTLALMEPSETGNSRVDVLFADEGRDKISFFVYPPDSVFEDDMGVLALDINLEGVSGLMLSFSRPAGFTDLFYAVPGVPGECSNGVRGELGSDVFEGCTDASECDDGNPFTGAACVGSVCVIPSIDDCVDDGCIPGCDGLSMQEVCTEIVDLAQAGDSVFSSLRTRPAPLVGTRAGVPSALSVALGNETLEVLASTQTTNASAVTEGFSAFSISNTRPLLPTSLTASNASLLRTDEASLQALCSDESNAAECRERILETAALGPVLLFPTPSPGAVASGVEFPENATSELPVEYNITTREGRAVQVFSGEATYLNSLRLSGDPGFCSEDMQQAFSEVLGDILERQGRAFQCIPDEDSNLDGLWGLAGLAAIPLLFLLFFFLNRREKEETEQDRIAEDYVEENNALLDFD